MYHNANMLPVTGYGPLMAGSVAGGSLAALSGRFWITALLALVVLTLALWNRFGQRGLKAGLVVTLVSVAAVCMTAGGLIGLLLLALAAFTLVGAGFALERSLPVALFGVFRAQSKQLAPTGRPTAPLHRRYDR